MAGAGESSAPSPDCSWSQTWSTLCQIRGAFRKGEDRLRAYALQNILSSKNPLLLVLGRLATKSSAATSVWTLGTSPTLIATSRKALRPAECGNLKTKRSRRARNWACLDIARVSLVPLSRSMMRLRSSIHATFIHVFVVHNICVIRPWVLLHDWPLNLLVDLFLSGEEMKFASSRSFNIGTLFKQIHR